MFAIHINDGEVNYDELDPNIRETVRKLQEAGFKTIDSGDGVHKFTNDFKYDTGHAPVDGEAFRFPNVSMSVTKENMVSEADRLWEVISGWGYGEPYPFQVQLMYCPGDVTPTILLTGIDDNGIWHDEVNSMYDALGAEVHDHD